MFTPLFRASWIWRTPLPFGILLASMVLDNVIRQFLTIASAYWSVIDLPLATFGLVASGMSLMGYFVPRVAKKLAEKRTPNQNFFLLCVLLMVGLFGISEAIPYWGSCPVLLYATMQSMNYLASRYLNEEAPSEQRATVLSFRGLSTNISYGAVSLLYSSLIAWIKQGVDPVIAGQDSEQDAVFVGRWVGSLVFPSHPSRDHSYFPFSFRKDTRTTDRTWELISTHHIRKS